MRSVRANDNGGRYSRGLLSEGVFSAEQHRYIYEELEKIESIIANHDAGYHARWDDLRFAFTQIRRGALLKPDFDATNVGLLFPQNDATEIVYIIAQIPHGYVPGSNLKPHIHWQQSAATLPTWKMDYKWFNNGEVIPASFTTISANTGVFTYSSGDLLQISSFPEIDGSGMKLSSIMLIKIYRDDNDVTGDVLSFEFDMHVLCNRQGTVSEFGSAASVASTGFPYTLPLTLE